MGYSAQKERYFRSNVAHGKINTNVRRSHFCCERVRWFGSFTKREKGSNICTPRFSSVLKGETSNKPSDILNQFCTYASGKFGKPFIQTALRYKVTACTPSLKHTVGNKNIWGTLDRDIAGKVVIGYLSFSERPDHLLSEVLSRIIVSCGTCGNTTQLLSGLHRFVDH